MSKRLDTRFDISSFEVKLFALKMKVEEPSSKKKEEDISALFNSVVNSIQILKETKKLEAICTRLEKNGLFEDPQDTSRQHSQAFLLIALKAIKYGLNPTCNKSYKQKWNEITDVQFREKIKKTQEQVKKMLLTSSTNNTPQTEEEITSSTRSRSNSFQTSPQDEKKSEFSLRKLKTSLSKVTGRFFNNSSASNAEKESFKKSSSKSRPNLFAVFSTSSSELIETNNEMASNESSKKELIVDEEIPIWEIPAFSNKPTHCEGVLLDFQKALLAHLMQKNSSPLLEKYLKIYLDEIMSKIEKSLAHLDSEEEFKPSKQLVMYCFLNHHYQVSLMTDRIYLMHNYKKPQVLEEIQNLLYFKKDLDAATPKMKLQKLFFADQRAIKDEEFKLAYSFLRKQSGHKWLTQRKFQSDYSNDPNILQTISFPQRTSQELPDWMLKWMQE